MIQPIELAIRQTARWVDSIQREKDRLSVEMRDPRASDIRWGFISARLAYLDVALEQARDLLRDLEGKRHRPELMFSKRPMLKMAAKRGAYQRRKEA